MMRVWDLDRNTVEFLINQIEEHIPGSCLFDKERFIAACNEGDILNEIIKSTNEFYESIGVQFECTADDLFALYDRYMS